MLTTIILDVSEKTDEYELDEFEVISPENFQEISSENALVICDSDEKVRKWNSFPVVGVEMHGCITSTKYVVSDPEAIDGTYLNMVYCRSKNILMTVAVGENVYLEELKAGIYDDIDEEYRRAMYDFYGYGLWGIYLKENDILIGRCGIEHRKIDDEVIHELGYEIDSVYRRKGYGKEAALLALDFAENYGIEKVITYINKENSPSAALSESIGMTFEKECTDGENVMLVYGITFPQE